MSENTDKEKENAEVEGHPYRRRDETPDPNADPQARETDKPEADKSEADGEPEVEGHPYRR